MKRLILVLLLQITVCSPFHAADPPKDAAPGFLSDLPELKGVRLGMSENAFQSLLAERKLRYESSITKDEVAYYVHVPTKENGANIYFGFRGASCTGIQRLQPRPKK
jgi:hypothetical protein